MEEPVFAILLRPDIRCLIVGLFLFGEEFEVDGFAHEFVVGVAGVGVVAAVGEFGEDGGVGGSRVTTSKSMTPSRDLLERIQSLMAMRMVSQAGDNSIPASHPFRLHDYSNFTRV